MSLKELLESSLKDKTEDSILVIDKGVANILAKTYSLERIYEIYKVKQIITLPLPPSSRNRNILPSKKSLKICILLSSFLWDHWEEIRSILNNLIFPSSENQNFSLKINIFCAVSQDIHLSIRTDFCPGNTTPYEYTIVFLFFFEFSFIFFMQNFYQSFCGKDLQQIFEDKAIKENKEKPKIEVKVKELGVLSFYGILKKVYFLENISDLYPVSKKYLHEESESVPARIRSEKLLPTWKEKIHLTTAGLLNLLSYFGVPSGKVDFWSVGASSFYLANLVSAFPVPSFPLPSSSATFSSAAVIFIDRVCPFLIPLPLSSLIIISCTLLVVLLPPFCLLLLNFLSL